MKGSSPRKKSRELVLLRDLAPRHDPMGGGAAGKPVFGEGTMPLHEDLPSSVRKGVRKKK